MPSLLAYATLPLHACYYLAPANRLLAARGALYAALLTLLAYSGMAAAPLEEGRKGGRREEGGGHKTCRRGEVGRLKASPR